MIARHHSDAQRLSDSRDIVLAGCYYFANVSHDPEVRPQKAN
jgi:hypothetical protein